MNVGVDVNSRELPLLELLPELLVLLPPELLLELLPPPELLLLVDPPLPELLPLELLLPASLPLETGRIRMLGPPSPHARPTPNTSPTPTTPHRVRITPTGYHLRAGSR